MLILKFFLASDEDICKNNWDDGWALFHSRQGNFSKLKGVVGIKFKRKADRKITTIIKGKRKFYLYETEEPIDFEDTEVVKDYKIIRRD